MAGSKKNEKYKAVLAGVRGIIRVLLYLLSVLFIIYVARSAYTFAYKIFCEDPMTSEEYAQNVIVPIPEEASEEEIADILLGKGLIADRDVFLIQARLSTWHGRMVGGEYVLRTSMTPTQIMEILARENTEGQFLLEEEEEEEKSSP